MATAHDVAAYILSKAQTPHSAVKLHKLIYYSQAWSLVWEEHPLFTDRIEAWINGPVVPAIYYVHRGSYEVSKWPKGDASSFPPEDSSTIDAVIGFYGQHNSQWLSDLTKNYKLQVNRDVFETLVKK